MPPHTTLPRPEGHVYFNYSPMSPLNWGIVPSSVHIFVYRDVKLALRALLQAATTIQAQRLEAGTATLFTDYLYFRGQSEITQRLLPTRLRGPQRDPTPRKRFRVEEFPSRSLGGPPSKDPREHFGDWYEEADPWRSIEDSVNDLSEEELVRRDAREHSAIERATQIGDVARLDGFQKRATVRHYSGAPSGLLDVSTNPEVAAFFATGAGSQPPPAGQIGLLWAIDLNFFSGLFAFEVASVPGGLKIKSRELRDAWGVNKQMFEEQGILPAALEITAVALPFRRPIAQHARFFSLAGEDGATLPLLTELTWWSIIERRAFSCGFIHDGQTYQNPNQNITQDALLPSEEKLAVALAP